MNIKKNGITRWVFVFDNFVVKVPNFKNGWCLFLEGFVANLHESNYWNYNNGNKLLCPVIWCSPLGFIEIMKRADVDRHVEEMKDKDINWDEYYDSWEQSGFTGDHKPSNYGYYEERLVKIDYA